MTQAQTIDCGPICEAPARRGEDSWVRELAREWWRLLVASGVGRGLGG